MEFKFNNKNILVCGSTYGIGHDIAKGFINDGANVIFTGRTMSRLSYIKKNTKKVYLLNVIFLTILIFYY